MLPSTIQHEKNWGTLMNMLGMQNPSSRALVAGAGVAGLAFIAKYPRPAFTQDGKLKPIGMGGPGPNSGSLQFLYLPVGAAVLTYLFT